MNWSELISAIAEREALPEETVRTVMRAAVDVSLESLAEGEDVTLHGLCTLGSRWQKPRSLRSIHDHRPLRLSGRFVPRIRPSSRLRRTLIARTPQPWRDDRHQAAWRVAQALIDDLDLYHEAQAPDDLDPAASLEDVQTRCARAFGDLWTQVQHTYRQQTPPEIHEQTNYLAQIAREQWGSRAEQASPQS